MKTVHSSLNLAKKYWHMLLGANVLMLLFGYFAISHATAGNSILTLTFSSLSAIFAAIDVWLLICLIFLYVARIAFLQNK